VAFLKDSIWRKTTCRINYRRAVYDLPTELSGETYKSNARIWTYPRCPRGATHVCVPLRGAHSDTSHTTWTGVVGLCLCGMFVISPLFPIAAFGLWGLLVAGSRREFGQNLSPSTAGLASVILSLYLCSPTYAATVSVPDTGITFQVPDDNTELSQAEVVSSLMGCLTAP